MYNNLMELDLLCKARIEEAERKAVLNRRARNVKSWEVQLLGRFWHGLSQLRNTHLPLNIRQLNYAAQQE
jgi:hypothetical protein